MLKQRSGWQLFIVLVAAVGIDIQPRVAFAGVPETILTLVTIVSSGKLAEELGVSVEGYWADTAPPGESIYSVTFDHMNKVSWADWSSTPDIFLMVECEGIRRIVVPEVHHDWDYSTKVITFRCQTLPAGSTCILRLCDDDGEMNTILLNLLSQPMEWKVKPVVKSGSIPKMGLVSLEATAEISGTMQLINPKTDHKITLNSPETVAVARFTVPKEPGNSKWLMSGNFVHSGKRVGQVEFTHWYTNPLPAFVGAMLNPRLLFWSAIVVVSAIFLVTAKFWRKSKEHPAETKMAP